MHRCSVRAICSSCDKLVMSLGQKSLKECPKGTSTSNADMDLPLCSVPDHEDEMKALECRTLAAQS